MAALTEIQSLEEIQYRSKIKFFFIWLLVPFIFLGSFLNHYPIGETIKAQIKRFAPPTCHPSFDQIRMEWFFPKIIISDLTLPASCLNRQGEALKFNHVTLNWQIISFSPFGIPFKLDTEMQGQPLSLYYVRGINEQMIRMKDQTINLSRLGPLLPEVKLAGRMVVDLNLSVTKNVIKNLAIKADSKDLEVPSMSVQGLTVPNLKLNVFHLEAKSTNHPRISVDKLFLGDPSSPIRANFKGKIDMQEGNMAFSPLDLVGEVAFSPSFVQSFPLIDMLFGSFTQKDGFYQIRLGGTLGAPKPSAP